MLAALGPPPASASSLNGKDGPVENRPRSSSTTQRLRRNPDLARTRCTVAHQTYRSEERGSVAPLPFSRPESSKDTTPAVDNIARAAVVPSYDPERDATSPLTVEDIRPRLSSAEFVRKIDGLLVAGAIPPQTRQFLVDERRKAIEYECHCHATLRVMVGVLRVV